VSEAPEQPPSEPEPEQEPTPNPDAIKAALERDQAASEQPDEGEPEPEAAEPDEPDPTSQALAEAHRAYLEAVMAALGPEAELMPCPACSGMGFNSVELPPDEYHARCPDCDGWGNVLSGSRVESQRVLPCQGCNGSGHVPRLREVATVPAAPGQVPVLPAYTPPPPPQRVNTGLPQTVVR